MKKVLVLSIAVFLFTIRLVSADTFGSGANQFTIDFVPISGSTNPTSGYGIVNNDYRMGTYEISNDQWNKFKTAYGTVTGTPSGGSYYYDAYDQAPYFPGTDLPTNCASWYEAAQFVNYLNTSKGYQAAYKFTGTQGTSGYTLGVWNASDSGYNAANPYRNSNAFYFLPTENEWVKAAYWNGTTLQTYATKAGERFYQGNGSNGGWNYHEGGFVTPYGPWNVGSGSQELNNTFNMMGNVEEWMESPYENGYYLPEAYRGGRGGMYGSSESYGPGALASSARNLYAPFDESSDRGFRIASVPEPASLLLFGLGAVILKRRR